ncbi:DUF3373 domain-containing protein [bacterium]|nr:DUF3373 domain-containing protein [bacterium]
MKRLFILLSLMILAFAIPAAIAQQSGSDEMKKVQDEIQLLHQTLEQLQQKLETMKTEQEEIDVKTRLDAVEKKSAMDRLNFTGEIRVANDFIDGTQVAHFDGLQLQKGIVDTMFYLQTNNGAFPMPSDPTDPNSIYQTLGNNVAANYDDYLLFTSRLKFDDLKAALGQFPPEAQQGLMQMLLPATARAEQDYRNSIFYTTRVRLNMKADIADNLSFQGRMAMYKAWGDSTGVQVFNGQANSINIDGTTTSVPNSDIVRIDRAYFDWNHIGDSGMYLSIGRRPSSAGPPTEIRENRLRGGTPMAHVVDFQFDGVTLGYVFDSEKLQGSVLRFCYGLGYESGFGSADQLKAPADRLADAHFGGFNVDVLATDRTFLQATILRAFDVPDGFNSLVVMPVDPVTGNPAPGPAVIRFTASRNLGDISLGGAVLERSDGPVKWFVSGAFSQTHPDNVTTPFGGLLSDPFSVPEGQTGGSFYAGLRYGFSNNKTFIGGEYNYGSKFWFNFTHAEDDIVLSKLATRGNVYEGYMNHEFSRNIMLRVAGIYYDYNYSGSGWHLGFPKSLDEMSVLGFPTYKDVFNLRTALYVKF